MYKDMADQLWEHAYQTFERRPGDGARTAFGNKPEANEVQFRMMHRIADLKTATDEAMAQKLANEIWGDVMIADLNGWMTDETANKMQEVIGSVLPLDQLES